MVVTHASNGGRVGGGNHAEVWAASSERLRVGRCDAQVVDHPALVPAALIVDDEEAGDVRKDVDERPHIIRIRREPGFSFKNLTTAPMVGRPQIGPVAVSIAASLMPGNKVVNGLDSKPF